MHHKERIVDNEESGSEFQGYKHLFLSTARVPLETVVCPCMQVMQPGGGVSQILRERVSRV